jgi:hypothetical protein
MTTPPTEDQPDAGRPRIARVPGANAPTEGDRAPTGRILAWLAVGALVLLGLVLYFIYSRRLSPLLG